MLFWSFGFAAVRPGGRRPEGFTAVGTASGRAARANSDPVNGAMATIEAPFDLRAATRQAGTNGFARNSPPLSVPLDGVVGGYALRDPRTLRICSKRYVRTGRRWASLLCTGGTVKRCSQEVRKRISRKRLAPDGKSQKSFLSV